MELRVIKQEDFDAKKTGKSLPFDQTVGRYEASMKRVPWSHCPDGVLRNGTSFMMKNVHTEGWLSMNVGERQLGCDGDAFVLTTCKENPGPIARSVFVVNKAEKMDIFGSDDIIRYGQKVKIEMNAYMYRKKLFVGSTPQSSQCYSPESRL